MSFTPSAAGKGDENRTKDFAAYRGSLFWKRSACCNAHVSPGVHFYPASGEGEAVESQQAYTCRTCGNICTLKP